MQKLKRTFLSLIMAISLILPSSAALAASTPVEPISSEVSSTLTPYSSIVTVAVYRDWDFTWRSAPEFVSLQMKCDTISLTATCKDANTVDSLVCHIVDQTYGGIYSVDLPFTANSSTTTYEWSLPAGKYTVYFTGDSDIIKSNALVTFTAIN